MGTMQTEDRIGYDVLTAQRGQKVFMMARFIAHSEAPINRRPLNLSLVLDRSGSMAGDKLDYTRQAAQFLIRHLGPDDIFSIVVYSEKVETLFMPQRIVNKDALSQRVNTIKPSGMTNLSGGWLEGCQHVRKHHNPSALNRVILLSDGLANQGITDRTELAAAARQQYEQGITTTTMGLGSDFNEDLLVEMANAGGGAFYFIESPEVAPQIFREELQELMQLIAQNLTVSVTPSDQVKKVRQLNAYPVSETTQTWSYRLGDLYAGEVKTLVLELIVPDLGAMGRQHIATVRFAYDALDRGGVSHHEHEMSVQVNLSTEEMPPTAEDVQVTQAVLLLQAANARKEAVEYADRGQFDEASRLLKAVADEIALYSGADDKLQEERSALLTEADELQRGSDAYGQHYRKVLFTQAYYTRRGRHQYTEMLRRRESERSSPPADPSAGSQASNFNATPTELRVTDELASASAPAEHAVPQQTTPTVVEWRGREFPLAGDLIRIGRAIHNEIVIDEAGVSRFHSQIRREDNSLWIEDLGSTNGTLVGGQRLTAPHRLSVGDVVYICDEKLVFK
jgi:Ca-activated chloride channel family protein